VTPKVGVLLATLAVLGGAFALLAPDPRPAQFDIVYVDNVGNCGGNTPCVSNITGALGLVNRTGLVFVYGSNRSYDEELNIDIPVTIRGESAARVVIDGGWFSGAVVRVGNQDVTIEGMTLTGDDYALEAGKGADGLAIRDVITGDVYGGLRIANVDGLVIEGSTVVGAQAYDGIEIQGSTNVLIGGSGNNVSDGAERGIYVNGSSEVEILDNIIMNNDGTGLNVSFSVNVTVTNNTILGNGGGFFTQGAAPGVEPLQGGNGGMWFWQTDPTAVESNVVMGNGMVGIGIAGPGSTDLALQGNRVTRNQGFGILVREGASRISIADEVSENRGSGIFLDNVTDVTILSSTIADNDGVGVHGQFAMNVLVRDSTITGNCAPIPFGTRSGNPPRPLGGHGGGLWFWQTDPSAVQGNTIRGNCAHGVTLIETTDFDVLANTIDRNFGDGVHLDRVLNTRIAGNTILGGGVAPHGVAALVSRSVTIELNAFQDLPIGILIQDGCDLRLGANTFTNVTEMLRIEGSPCNVTFSGFGSLRFMPRTLNLASQGQTVTLRFEVEGLDPSQFDIATLVFMVNGVQLAPPPGSPSEMQIQGDRIRAMVKLDRPEAIAAFGASGTYEVTVSGVFMPGVTWLASDFVDAILP